MKRNNVLTVKKTPGKRKKAGIAGKSRPRKKTESKLHNLIKVCLDDAKALEIVSIDLAGKSSMADFMIVSSGRSQRHVGAIADQIAKKLKAQGYGKARIEGLPQCDWVLVDAGDVVAHIFRPEVREFYNLERLWSTNLPSEKLAV